MKKKNELVHCQGTLNPLHPWLLDYWPTLARKIVQELSPWGMIKLTHWLSTDAEPLYPVRILTGYGRIMGVSGNTRLARAMLLKEPCAVTVAHTVHPRHPLSPDLVRCARSLGPQRQFLEREDPRPPGWPAQLAQAHSVLLSLNIDPQESAEHQILQLHTQLQARSASG